MSQNSPYGTKTPYMKFELDLRCKDGRQVVEVLDIGGQKIKFASFFYFGVKKFRQDERIPNLVSKL